MLQRLARVRRRVADRRDAPRQERTAERLAVARTEMRVNLDQARDYGLCRRVDHVAVVVLMRTDRHDPVPVDRDVDVLLDTVAAPIPKAAGVDGPFFLRVRL